jgi:hypothetical protein
MEENKQLMYTNLVISVYGFTFALNILKCFKVCNFFQIISICFFSQHGEPGAAVVELQSVDVVVEHVLKQILSQV